MGVSRKLIAQLAALSVASCVVLAPGARAASPESKPAGWQFEATPYLWGAGLDGDVKIGRLPSGGVEASFSDLLGLLDMAVMGSFEGRKDRWGFFTDGMYMKVWDTQPTPRAGFGDANVDLTMRIHSAAGSYRALEGQVSVDVFAGPRYVSLDTNLELTTGIASGRSASAGRSWWDAYGGTVVRYHPTPKWLVTGYVDVGGGGLKLTWQAIAGAGYQFNKLVSLKFGYRYLDIDYDKDQFVYDMAMAGPYVGVGFHF